MSEYPPVLSVSKAWCGPGKGHRKRGGPPSPKQLAEMHVYFLQIGWYKGKQWSKIVFNFRLFSRLSDPRGGQTLFSKKIKKIRNCLKTFRRDVLKTKKTWIFFKKTHVHNSSPIEQMKSQKPRQKTANARCYYVLSGAPGRLSIPTSFWLWTPFDPGILVCPWKIMQRKFLKCPEPPPHCEPLSNSLKMP